MAQITIDYGALPSGGEDTHCTYVKMSGAEISANNGVIPCGFVPKRLMLKAYYVNANVTYEMYWSYLDSKFLRASTGGGGSILLSPSADGSSGAGLAEAPSTDGCKLNLPNNWGEVEAWFCEE